MLACIRRNNQHGNDFDAIQFELDRENLFNQIENQYFEANYEAEPYYSNRTYISGLDSRERIFKNNQKAIKYIIRSYES